MPHLSKKELHFVTKNNIDEKMIIMITETGNHTRKKIFNELLTKTERLMIAKRLFLIKLIEDNIPTHTIAKILKMSPSTVSRYELRHKKGHYYNSIAFLKSIGNLNKFERIVKELIKIPFESRKKSFYKITRDI